MTGAVVWLTGLPASGKSTLARRLAGALRARGAAVLVLDGDEVRELLVPAPGHDDAGRDAFYTTLARLAAHAAAQGLVAIVPATAHRRAWRELARRLAPRYLEVHVATPLTECERRDPKGLYGNPDARVRLPGVGVAYEPPEAADVVARGGQDDIAVASIERMLER